MYPPNGAYRPQVLGEQLNTEAINRYFRPSMGTPEAVYMEHSPHPSPVPAPLQAPCRETVVGAAVSRPPTVREWVHKQSSSRPHTVNVMGGSESVNGHSLRQTSTSTSTLRSPMAGRSH